MLHYIFAQIECQESFLCAGCSADPVWKMSAEAGPNPAPGLADETSIHLK